jgi:ribonucleoside-diphosphate reductase alpha chain
MHHPLFEEWKKSVSAKAQSDRPDYFVCANDLTPMEHAAVQAAAQEYIDSSISKTVNAPNSHAVEDVKTLYMAAYDLGLKGVTYMRDGSREGVLSRVDTSTSHSTVSSDRIGSGQVKKEEPKPVAPRPMSLSGVTYKMETPVGHTYITINHNENKEPFEVFMTIGKVGSDVAAMADALGRMISLNLRLTDGLSPRERIKQVVAQLVGIGGARSIGFGRDRVRSLPDAVAKVLSTHYGFALNGNVEDKPLTNGEAGNGLIASNATHANGLSNGQTTPKIVDPQTEPEVVKMQQLAIDGGSSPVMSDTSTSLYDLCPECGGGSLAYEEGCRKCYACGYSE